MMLYANFSQVFISDKPFSHHPSLGLTSKRIHGYCHTFSTQKEIEYFFSLNNFSSKAKQSLLTLFQEDNNNNILIFLMDNRKPKLQNEIIDEYLKRRINVAHSDE